MAIRVDGCRAASAPATFAQRALWSAIEWIGPDDPYFNLGWKVPLPDDVDLERLVAALRRLVEHLDTFRTTFEVRGGTLWQTVAAGGALDLEIHEATEAASGATAATVLRRFLDTPFRAGDQWPVALAAVTVAGVPRVLVLSVNHLALDMRGWEVVDGVLRGLLSDPRCELPTTRRQPVDQAIHEASPAGQAANRKALDRWDRILRAAPPTVFDSDTFPEEDDRYWMFRLDSRAAAAALPLVAERTRTTDGAVLMAATSAVLAAFTGHTDIVLQASVPNRVAKGCQSMAGYMVWDSLYRIELDGLAFDEAARQSLRAALATYRHGVYDSVAARAVRATVEAEVGAHIDLGCHVNDRRLRTGPTGALVRRTRPDPVALLPDSRLSFVRAEPRVDTRVHLHASDPDVATIALDLMCDTRYVPVPMIGELLHAIERLLVAAVPGDLAPEEIRAIVGLPGPERGPGWERHGKGWVHVPESRRLLRRVLGPDVALSTERSEDGTSRLVGYVGGDAAGRGPRELHAAVVEALHDRSDVRAPDVYVCCAAAPADVDDESAWARCDVVERGSGRVPVGAPSRGDTWE